MKTVRPTYTEEYGQFMSDIYDEDIGRGTIVGWVIDEEYFVASRECPAFDPRDGSRLEDFYVANGFHE